MRKQVKRPTPISIPPLNSHLEFQKFNTYTEGMILDEIERLAKEDKEKQVEIDELYKQLEEKEKVREKEQEAEKKVEKIKLPLLKPDVTAVGLQKPKTNDVSKKLLSKPSRTVFRSPLPRWH